jgi:hypothetical protein
MLFDGLWCPIERTRSMLGWTAPYGIDVPE